MMTLMTVSASLITSRFQFSVHVICKHKFYTTKLKISKFLNLHDKREKKVEFARALFTRRDCEFGTKI